MAPTPTTTDAFHAVAEPSRRDLLDALGTGEATVGELVDRLGLSQPQVSKHLGVLRAGLASCSPAPTDGIAGTASTGRH
jgi:DNA-binding transcriptional ArsR family regulator